jgi:hypothetical protein
MTDLDDWPDPTHYRFGPVDVYRSNAGYGWEIVVAHRVQFLTRNAVTRMPPHAFHGSDENCNRTLALFAWPLGGVVVWYHPTQRTEPCLDCQREAIREGMCPLCQSRPCMCAELGRRTV